jgi:hypothetical protein
VSEVTCWEDVEHAALVAGTCIKPGGVNNERAKESFEAGGVRYFIQESRDARFLWDVVGYIRLHKVSESSTNCLWIVDFGTPFSYRAIRLVRQQLGAPLLAHKLAADDFDLAESWPSLPLKLSKASEFKFHQCQGTYESTWLVVP